MKKTQSSITVVEQAIVYIAGYPVLAVLLPDGRVAAVFRMLCEALHLDHHGQIQRVQKHPVLANALLLAHVATTKGIRPANVLIGESIDLWLAEIEQSRVAPEAREILKQVQEEAFNALRRKFAPEAAEAP